MENWITDSETLSFEGGEFRCYWLEARQRGEAVVMTRTVASIVRPRSRRAVDSPQWELD